MSLSTECLVALTRATIIALAAVSMGVALRSVLQNLSHKLHRIAWALLLIPFITPVLLIGYAYSAFSLSLIRQPLANEAFYCALLWFKLTSVTTLVLYFAPSAMSSEAWHCYRLSIGRGTKLASTFIFQRLRAPATAFAVVFLLAFGEFELASLLQIKTWTVSIFDAHAGGLALSESLRLALLPMICEVGILAVVVALLFKQRRSVPGPANVSPNGATTRTAAAIFLAMAAFVICVIPVCVAMQWTINGFSALAQTTILSREVGASIVLSVVAAMCAFFAAGWLKQTFWPAVLLSLPALLGALVLSLLLLAVFQLRPLRAMYDTPLPLALALVLLVFPAAILLRALLDRIGARDATHLAMLMKAYPPLRARARTVIWALRTRVQFWAAFLVFCWAYFDLTASSLLAPTGVTPVFVRLYNFTHYGQSAVLSAMICVAFAVPVALAAATGGAGGLFSRLSRHE